MVTTSQRYLPIYTTYMEDTWGDFIEVVVGVKSDPTNHFPAFRLKFPKNVTKVLIFDTKVVDFVIWVSEL
jgi:hypothetical protein